MSDSSNQAQGGIGTLGVLGIVFVTLKLCGAIDWNWAYVLLPFWVPLALWLLIMAIVLMVYGFASLKERFS